MRFSKPLDENLITKLAKEHTHLVTIEDNTVSGGSGTAVLEVLSKNNIYLKTLLLGYPDGFPEHGSQDEIYEKIQLNEFYIKKRIVNFMSK